MSALLIYKEDGSKDGEIYKEKKTMATILKSAGVQFEQWEVKDLLPNDASQQEVLSVYKRRIDSLIEKYEFKTVDVVSLNPDDPEKDEMRKKFLAEHTHEDFEVRYFVDGRGLFYFHIKDKVYVVLCEKGDLISVPAYTTHWFDMGSRPQFKCIRFFTTPDGWIGEFTGSNIAKKFPSFDKFMSMLK